MKHHRALVMAFILLFVMFPLTGASAQTGENRVFILETNASAFPDVSFIARVVNAQGQAVEGLTADSFSIGEVHDPPLMVASGAQPLNIVFIIDTTINSMDEQRMIRDILTQFRDRAYQPGDVVTVLPVSAEPLTLTSADGFAAVFSSLRFNGSRIPDEIASALDRAKGILTPQVSIGHNAQIVFIGSYLPAGQITYSDPTVPLHVLQVHRGRGQFTARFRALATGAFAEISDIGASSIAGFNTLLNSQRVTYNVRYRSRAAGMGTRQVPVSVNVMGGVAYGTFSYQADVLPPQVEIVRSESNFDVRGTATLADVDGSQGYNYDKRTEQITAAVSFPDSLVRPIQSARLVIDGQAQEDVSISLNGTNEFTLSWPLQDYVNRGKVEIAVEVTDYFNQIATSPQRAFTINFAFPKIETPVDECMANGQPVNSPECLAKNNAPAIFGTMGVMALVVVGMGGVIIWQRRQITGVARKVGRTFVQLGTGMAEVGRRTTIAMSSMFGAGDVTAVEDIDPQTRGGTTPAAPGSFTAVEDQSTGQAYGHKDRTQIEHSTGLQAEDPALRVVPETALATFIVRQSPLNISNITMSQNQPQLTLGRDEEHGTDFVIAMPSISRIHCTIRYDHNQRQFTVVDQGSANGTYINDQRLEPEKPRIIVPGDIIRLSTKNPFVMQFMPNPRLKLGGGVEPAPEPKRTVRVTLVEDEIEDDTAAAQPLTTPVRSSGVYSSVPPTPPPPGNNHRARNRQDAPLNEDDSWID